MAVVKQVVQVKPILAGRRRVSWFGENAFARRGRSTRRDDRDRRASDNTGKNGTQKSRRSVRHLDL
jgi:hypothetical protein